MATFWPGSGGSASVTVSPTEPENPVDDELWYDSSGTMYIYYNDGSSAQFVQLSGPVPAGLDPFLLPGM